MGKVFELAMLSPRRKSSIKRNKQTNIVADLGQFDGELGEIGDAVDSGVAARGLGQLSIVNFCKTLLGLVLEPLVKG